jgi:hypothetical protein
MKMKIESDAQRWDNVMAPSARLSKEEFEKYLSERRSMKKKMTQAETVETLDQIHIFKADCGHRWVGSMGGRFACPTCGRYDGDHHLISAEPIAVQLDDWGTLCQSRRDSRG